MVERFLLETLAAAASWVIKEHAHRYRDAPAITYIQLHT